MLHGNKNKQLSRKQGPRNALIKTLAVSFIRHGKISTTNVKAKVLQSFVEKLITKGIENTLHARRIIASRVGQATADKIIKEIAPKYKSRHGGYTRVIKLNTRLSDGSKMAQIELV